MSERISDRILQDAYDRTWAAVKRVKAAQAELDAAKREHRESWDALDGMLSNLDPRQP